MGLMLLHTGVTLCASQAPTWLSSIAMPCCAACIDILGDATCTDLLSRVSPHEAVCSKFGIGQPSICMAPGDMTKWPK